MSNMSNLEQQMREAGIDPDSMPLQEAIALLDCLNTKHLLNNYECPEHGAPEFSEDPECWCRSFVDEFGTAWIEVEEEWETWPYRERD